MYTDRKAGRKLNLAAIDRQHDVPCSKTGNNTNRLEVDRQKPIDCAFESLDQRPETAPNLRLTLNLKTTQRSEIRPCSHYNAQEKRGKTQKNNGSGCDEDIEKTYKIIVASSIDGSIAFQASFPWPKALQIHSTHDQFSQENTRQTS